MQYSPKAVWNIPYVSVAFFPSLKNNFIVYRSAKVAARPDFIFEIHHLWQSGFSRVYSNCCCAGSFEPEIIKFCQSSHKMYHNNIESSCVYNNVKCLYKKVWKLINGFSFIYIYIYIYAARSFLTLLKSVSIAYCFWPVLQSVASVWTEVMLVRSCLSATPGAFMCCRSYKNIVFSSPSLANRVCSSYLSGVEEYKW